MFIALQDMAKSKKGSSEERVPSIEELKCFPTFATALFFPLKLLLAAIVFALYYIFVKPIMWISTTRFRWVVVIPLVLPMSKIHTWLSLLRAKIFFALYGASPAQAEQRHQEKVFYLNNFRDAECLVLNYEICACLHSLVSPSFLYLGDLRHFDHFCFNFKMYLAHQHINFSALDKYRLWRYPRER